MGVWRLVIGAFVIGETEPETIEGCKIYFATSLQVAAGFQYHRIVFPKGRKEIYGAVAGVFSGNRMENWLQKCKCSAKTIALVEPYLQV